MATEEDLLGPIDNMEEDLEEYAFAGVKQVFSGIVTPNNSNVNKNNINVVYKVYDSNNTLLSTLNANTNSNGEHTVQYTFPHKGNYNIIASVGDDTYTLPVSVESLVDSITASSSSNSVIAGNNVILSANVLSSVSTPTENADVKFIVTQNIDSFTEERQLAMEWDSYELDYDVKQSCVDFECKAKSAGQCYLSIIPKNSNNETILLSLNYSSYKTVKVVDDGTSLKYYVDGALQGTIATGIKKLYVYGEGYVKEVSMTTHDTVTANTTNIAGNVNVDYTYPGGTCTVKAIADYGVDSNESASITISESSLFDGITLTSDKDILNYNGGTNPESATLTAQLTKNGANANVSGKTVTFEVRKDSDDSLVETLTGTTDSSGKAIVYYSGKAVGDISIKAECMYLTKTYVLQDYLFKPPLDGTDAITSWTSMTNKTENGIYYSHGSFLNDGWSNEELWQLDFDVQTSNWWYIGLMPVCSEEINPYTDAKSKNYAMINWEGLTYFEGLDYTIISETTMTKITSTNIWHHVTIQKLNDTDCKIIINNTYESIRKYNNLPNLSKLHFGTRDNPASRKNGGIVQFKNIKVILI